MAPGIGVGPARQPWSDVEVNFITPAVSPHLVGLSAPTLVGFPPAPTTAEAAAVAGDPPTVHAPDRDVERSPADPPLPESTAVLRRFGQCHACRADRPAAGAIPSVHLCAWLRSG